jgi:hypothetical protein
MPGQRRARVANPVGVTDLSLENDGRRVWQTGELVVELGLTESLNSYLMPDADSSG